MFEQVYGFSCVENQVLARLKSRGMDIVPLYHEAAMPIKELFFFMVIEGKKQEYFDRVTRAQDLLRDMGIIDFRRRRARCDDLPDMIRNQPDTNDVLIRVNEGFAKEVLHARALRSDHFVLVSRNGDGFVLLNDIPELAVPVNDSGLIAAAQGEYFLLTVCRDITDEDREALWRMRRFRAENHIPFCFYKKDLEGIPEVGIRLRNMAGIYKALRRRMAAYYGDFVDTAFIRERIPQMERYYAMLEYYNLKKTVPLEKYFLLLDELNGMEQEIMKELKCRLEEGRLCCKERSMLCLQR